MKPERREAGSHYPTSRLRVNYVVSRCEGRALRYIGPRAIMIARISFSESHIDVDGVYYLRIIGHRMVEVIRAFLG